MNTTHRLIEFVGNHWGLALAFLGITILIIYNELRRRLAGTQQLGPHAATLAMNTDATVILDVREDSEYKQGHIANAVHIPLGQLAKRLTELDKYRERPLIAYCRTGNRSNSAAQLLHKHGFTTVHNLAGGIVAWQNANLPVTKK
ncbi:MAG TPA: rhodanese-like domain-containing protein [Gammaproteobacteria bacterium]|jgi:rhodanese-related sulfurtransferase|nr:rhodanese-like domain-containing protein [Gammaproteobacteria bacterium]